MTRDRQQRSTLARVDNEDRKFKIAAARRLIYEKNYAVDSRALEKLLKDESLVPTSVRAMCILSSLPGTYFSPRMLSRINYNRSDSIYS